MRLILFAAAAAVSLASATSSPGCDTAAACVAGSCEVAVVAPVVVVRVAVLRPRGCGLMLGVRGRRAVRVERRAVRRVGRRLFRGRLRGGCCG